MRFRDAHGTARLSASHECGHRMEVLGMLSGLHLGPGSLGSMVARRAERTPSAATARRASTSGWPCARSRERPNGVLRPQQRSAFIVA